MKTSPFFQPDVPAEVDELPRKTGAAVLVRVTTVFHLPLVRIPGTNTAFVPGRRSDVRGLLRHMYRFTVRGSSPKQVIGPVQTHRSAGGSTPIQLSSLE